MNSGIGDAEAAASAVQRALSSSEEADRRGHIDDFACVRGTAAMRNRDAAEKALRHMQACDLLSRTKRYLAAALAPRVPRLGEWLESGPYGPRSRSASGIY